LPLVITGQQLPSAATLGSQSMALMRFATWRNCHVEQLGTKA